MTDNTQSGSDNDVTRKHSLTEVEADKIKGTQGLDVILALLNARMPQPKTMNEATARVAMLQGTKQAVLDWHNKQMLELLDRLEQGLPDTSFHGISIRVKEKIRDGGYADGVRDSRLTIEAERNKLKESK